MTPKPPVLDPVAAGTGTDPVVHEPPTPANDPPKDETPDTYKVKKGDTLSKIAKELLGNANAYPQIFEANRDQLSDPDKIKPGQVLKIPTPR